MGAQFMKGLRDQSVTTSIEKCFVQRVYLFLGQGDEMKIVQNHFLHKTLLFSKKLLFRGVGGTVWR